MTQTPTPPCGREPRLLVCSAALVLAATAPPLRPGPPRDEAEAARAKGGEARSVGPPPRPLDLIGQANHVRSGKAAVTKPRTRAAARLPGWGQLLEDDSPGAGGPPSTPAKERPISNLLPRASTSITATDLGEPFVGGMPVNAPGPTPTAQGLHRSQLLIPELGQTASASPRGPYYARRRRLLVGRFDATWPSSPTWPAQMTASAGTVGRPSACFAGGDASPCRGTPDLILAGEGGFTSTVPWDHPDDLRKFQTWRRAYVRGGRQTTVVSVTGPLLSGPLERHDRPAGARHSPGG